MPILAMLCIGGLAGFAGWAASRRAKGTKIKWLARTSAALVVICVFLGDEIAGRLYFAYLCATKTKVNVLKRAQLQAQYWNTNDVPESRIEKDNSRYLIRIGS